jgi:hypothetical protein
MPRSLLRLALACLAAALALGPARAGGLDEEDTATVRRLAEEAIKAKGLYKGKIYFTQMEVIRDASGKKVRHHALVTHYRYDGNLGIVTSVDLDRGEVTKVEAVPNLPTSLSPEEAAEAERLARAYPEVAKALARYSNIKVEADTVVTYTIVPGAFGHNHRLVRLFFRHGRDYLLHAPNVDVDLTTGAVRAQSNDKVHTP